MFVKEISEIIRGLKDSEWSTKTGCFVYASVIFVLASGVIKLLAEVGIVLGGFWPLGILVGLQVIHFIGWFVKRNYFYDPNVLTVAFAVATEETSRNYYKEIKKRFREQIANYKLQDDMRIKELPTDISFPDAISAEAFVAEKGIRLLVWGNTTEGNLGNAPFSQFNIKFTYQHVVTDEEKRKKLVEDIDLASQRTMWGIRQPESFHHLTVVSGNVFEISLYTFGACLWTVPNISYLLKSVDIFEKLQTILKVRKQDVNFPNLQLVRQKTRSSLSEAYTFLLVFYWSRARDLDKSIEYADKAIKIDGNNFIAHQNMAVLQWLKGDKNKARLHTERAWQIRPGHPLPRFNKAFFFIYDRRYEQGLKQYKKIQHAGETNIIDVIEFIEKEFEKSQENLGLLFAAGWLNVQYADQVRGIEQLQRFFEQAKNDQSYAILITETQRILAARPV